MNSWVETSLGTYINLQSQLGLWVRGSGSNWSIRTFSPTSAYLKGTYSSEDDAKHAMRKLVHGVDPTTIV